GTPPILGRCLQASRCRERGHSHGRGNQPGRGRVLHGHGLRHIHAAPSRNDHVATEDGCAMTTADLGLTVLFSALSIEGEGPDFPTANAQSYAPLAAELLDLIPRCDSAEVYDFLRTAAVNHSTLVDEPSIDGDERDGYVARSAFLLGVATA